MSPMAKTTDTKPTLHQKATKGPRRVLVPLPACVPQSARAAETVEDSSAPERSSATDNKNLEALSALIDRM